jgi:hypothetical protein
MNTHFSTLSQNKIIQEMCVEAAHVLQYHKQKGLRVKQWRA